MRAWIVALLLCVLSAGTLAQERLPSGPVTLVVGAAAGGGIDITARLLAQRLATRLGQPVVVENRPGAGSRIANEYVARATPDGRTLLIATAAMTVDSAFQARAGIDTLRELAPVSTIASTPMIAVVKPSLPVTSLQELIVRARNMPGALNYASSGQGTTGHLYAELFKLRTSTDILHIPFKGTAPALAALLAGDVDLSFVPLPGVLQYVRAGRLRALATSGTTRADVMPDVPTMEEAGLANAQADVWYGILAPARTPPVIVDALAEAIAEISRSPDFRRQLVDLGEQPFIAGRDEFGRLLHAEVARWTEVIKAARIRAE